MMGIALLRFNRDAILYCNDAGARIFGYSVKEIYQVPAAALFGDPFDWRKMVDILPSNPIEGDGRILFQRKDNTNFWGQLNCTFVETKGGQYYDAVITNIDDLIHHERVAEESKMMLEKLQAELDRFIYSASHDLRAPISSMMGMIHLMKINPSTNDLLDNLNMIDQSLIKLDKVIEKLVSFSENSNGPLQSSQIDFVVLEENLRVSLRDHEHFEKIEFTFVRNGDQVFFSDPHRLQLILYHLIKNCYDFADLRKSMPTVTVTVHTQSDKLVVEIFDNGIGILRNQLGKVFTLFYRASEQSKGSGIGLFLVREAVIKLAGTVEIRSEYGVGTSVTMMIPNSSKGRLINKKRKLQQADLKLGSSKQEHSAELR